MKSGIYAIAALDGAAIDASDIDALGLAPHVPAASVRLADMALRIVDTDGTAVHLSVTDSDVLAFLGHLDEPADVAGALGVSSDTDVTQLISLALERFGPAAPARVLGEWSLVAWHRHHRRLTLMVSESMRDQMFLASSPGRVAVSPDISRLASLNWVGRELDPAGFALQLSRARLRRCLTTETPLKKVARVVPGTRRVVESGADTTSTPETPALPDRWPGSFEDAVEALEAVLLRIVRQQLARHRAAAFLLSGGLDSTLLTWLGSRAQGAGRGVFCLTSIGPNGRGLADEREFAAAVSDALLLKNIFVAPPPDANAFIPARSTFAHWEFPVASPRHYLYDALRLAASENGADVILDGSYGEQSVTSKELVEPAGMWRRGIHRARAWQKERQTRRGWPALAFHARLSADALQALPREWADVWRAPYVASRRPRPHEQWGFTAAIAKNAMSPTSTPLEHLRHVFPFRDRRLLRLMASMPAEFTQHQKVSRSLARAMLRERVPDRVRLRTTGGPFSPDYIDRMRSQADTVFARLPLYRAVGAGNWLDLIWLERALKQVQDPHQTDMVLMTEIQSTTVAAEYLAWWNRLD